MYNLWLYFELVLDIIVKNYIFIYLISSYFILFKIYSLE